MNYDFDQNLLLQALRDGSTQEEIASKFAEALNKASAEVRREEIKRQKEAEEAKRKNEQKLVHAQAVADFYNIYYPDFFGTGEKITGKSIVEACDAASDLFKSFSVKIPKNSAGNPLSFLFDL